MPKLLLASGTINFSRLFVHSCVTITTEIISQEKWRHSVRFDVTCRLQSRTKIRRLQLPNARFKSLRGDDKRKYYIRMDLSTLEKLFGLVHNSYAAELIGNNCSVVPPG